MRLHPAIAGLVVAAMLSAGAFVQAAWAQDRNNGAALAEARELMVVTKTVDITKQMLPLMLKSSTEVVARANPGIAAQVRKLMEELFLPEITARIPAFVDDMAVLYTKHFTPEELQQMNAFYGTPLGQKVIATTPLLLQQSAALREAWGRRSALDVLSKIAPKLRARGLNI